MQYQIVPPHYHRQNIKEKAIETFRDLFGGAVWSR
jgi:hypothetical protein